MKMDSYSLFLPLLITFSLQKHFLWFGEVEKKMPKCPKKEGKTGIGRFMVINRKNKGKMNNIFLQKYNFANNTNFIDNKIDIFLSLISLPLKLKKKKN